jgi:DNA-directed RNA polymerase specialized sigma subunit
MNQGEIEEVVDQILLKKAGGEKLTNREQKILAYAYYAERRQRMTVRAKPRDRDPG